MAEHAQVDFHALQMEYEYDAVGWERWLMALGIPRLSAAEYGRSMEHKGLVYILRQIFHVIPL